MALVKPIFALVQPTVAAFRIGDALLGARRIILAVNKRNLKAVNAYRRNGFAVVESVVTDFGNGFVMNDFIMAKNL